MKHHRLIRFTAALGGLFLAGMLHAMPPAPSPIEMFDKDGSGTVNEEEFNAGRAERMAKMAKTGRPMRHAGQGPQFSDIDADKDGEVTLDEFIAARRAMMEKRRAERMAWRSGMPGTMPPMRPDYQHRGGCMHKGGKHGMAKKEHHGGCMHKGGKHGMAKKGHHGGCMHKGGKHGMANKGHSGGCKHKSDKHAMAKKGQHGGCMSKGGKQGEGKGHQGKHKPRYSFEDIDLDGDGMISKEEFEKHRASR